MNNIASDGSGKILKTGAVFRPISFATINTNGLIVNLDAGNSNSYSGSGNTWTDLSGVSNNATLVNTPTYETLPNAHLSFNGSDEYVTLPSNFFNQNNDDPFSVSVWFRSASTGIIFGQQDTATPDNASGYVPAIYIGTDGKLRTSIYWGGSTSNIQTSTDAVNDNKWRNITVTFASNIQKSYLNGVAFGGSLSKTQNDYSATYYYFLGTGKYASWPSAAASPYFNGSISVFLYYNRELSAVESKNIYNAYRGRYGV